MSNCLPYCQQCFEETISMRKRVRAVHRKVGVLLFVLFTMMALTGMLLGWKHHFGFVQHATVQGSSNNVSLCLPTDSLMEIAAVEIKNDLGADTDVQIKKLDIRPDKGTVKVIFSSHYHSLQLDATTGEVLMREYRTADLIEDLHDGSVVDRWLNFPKGLFKLIYSSFMGIALAVVSISGIWMYKRRRKK